MTETETTRLMLITYAETQSPITQEFYQALCLRAAETIEQLQERLEASQKLLTDLGFRKDYESENVEYQERIANYCIEIAELQEEIIELQEELAG